MEIVPLHINIYNPSRSFQRELKENNYKEYAFLMKYTNKINAELGEVFDSHGYYMWDEFFERTKDDIFLVCIDKNKIIGMIFAERFSKIYEPYSRKYFSISYVIVDRKYARAGIAKILYMEAIKKILQKGGSKVFASFIDMKGKNLFCSVATAFGETPSKESKAFELSFNISKEKYFSALEKIKNKKETELIK